MPVVGGGGGSGTGTPTSPIWRLKANGTTYNWASGPGTGWFDELIAYQKDGRPQLTWHLRGGALPGLPDPFLGKTITLEYDPGTGYVLVFTGDCLDVTSAWGARGWQRNYVALGIRNRADWVPLTNHNDLTDLIIYNRDTDDPAFRAALAGRSAGQMILDVLHMPENNAGLAAYGIGNYNSTGYGASATCTLSGGAVNAFSVTSGGSNYGSTAPNVVLAGGGGSGATGTAHLTAGVVTSITGGGGSGYSSPPVVLISTLPVATLTDIAALITIPPFPTPLQGEKILEAIEGPMRQIAPLHTLWVDPNGNIRIYDMRSFPVTHTFTMGTDPIDVERVSLTRSVRDCFTRVKTRGAPNIQPILATKSNGMVQEDFAHDGLTNAEAKQQWSLAEFTQAELGKGQATAGAITLSSGVITAVAVGSTGYDYGGTTPGVHVIPSGGGSGASVTAVMSGSLNGSVASFTVGAGGTGYTSAVKVTVDAPSGGNGDAGTCTVPSTTTVTVTPSDARKIWASNYWDQSSSGRQGIVCLNYSVGSNIDVSATRRIVSNTALTAGGTSTLTLDSALPATNYDSYVIFGVAGGGNNTWQLYSILPAAVAGAMQDQFPYPVPFRSADGTAVTMTSTPSATILYSSSGSPPYAEAPLAFTQDPVAGTIRFVKPVVVPFGTHNNLVIGGSSTDGIPNDIRVLLAIANGVYNSVQPPDSKGSPTYSGTANSVEGITRTLTITVPSWRDGSNQANMDVYTADVLATVSNTIVEGTIPYLGIYLPALTFGLAVNLTGNGYTTGFESLNLPVLECRLTFTEHAGSKYITTMRVSNRKAQYTSALFTRPPRTGLPLGLSSGSFEGAGISNPEILGIPGGGHE